VTPKELKYHSLYLDIAERVAQMSHAVRAKVGALMVKDGNILGFGWNGMPGGMDNTCEHFENMNLVTNSEVSHAEENLLGKIAKSTVSSEGATVYITLSPCIHCAKLLATCGIKKVVFRDQYRDNDGAEFLSELGIAVIQIGNHETL